MFANRNRSAVVLSLLLTASGSSGARAMPGKPGDCKPKPVVATGAVTRDMNAATTKAYEAVEAKIKATYGAGWGAHHVSRRGL